MSAKRPTRLRVLAMRELRYGRADRRAVPMRGTLTLAECAELDALRAEKEVPRG